MNIVAIGHLKTPLSLLPLKPQRRTWSPYLLLTPTQESDCAMVDAAKCIRCPFQGPQETIAPSASALQDLKTCHERSSSPVEGGMSDDSVDFERPEPGEEVESSKNAQLTLTDDEDGGDNSEEGMSDDDGEAQRMFFAAARIANVKRCFSDIMEIVESDAGVSPEMYEIIEEIMEKVESAVEVIGRYKRRIGQ